MKIGDIVEVGPNTASFHGADHFEPVWKGRILRIQDGSVDVQPLDVKKGPRNVLKDRIS
jgi:hypothetical protein